MLDTGTSCQVMLYGQGGPPGVSTRVHFVNSVGHEMVVPRTDAVVLAARPAQGHYSGNAKRFQPFPQSGQEWPDMAPFVR